MSGCKMARIVALCHYFSRVPLLCLFLIWDSLHGRLNSYYDAWSYKEKKDEEIKAYMKSV